MTNPFHTIGHGTRPIGEFMDLLRGAQVNCVVDVRTVPRSRTNPQYNRDALPAALGRYQIGYEHLAALGGLRGKAANVPPTVNAFWEHQSFHNYADYAMRPHSAAARGGRTCRLHHRRELMNKPGQPSQGFAPVFDHRGPPKVRRFEAQRWLIDNIIRANGIDWDQPRSLYIHAPCGIAANADFAGIRERVRKMADIGPAFAAVARRREAKAKAALADDRKITARDNFFMAAVHWGAAQWPYDENDETNIAYNNNKRACYTQYAALSDHHVEAVWVPFKDKAIPAWLHLPPGHSSGKLPLVIAIPGMDSYKELQVALYGDRFLSRGIAVLAIDGPGQYEAPMIGLYFSMENWMAAGPAVVDWIAARPELDAGRVAVSGTSFGSLFGTVLTANEPRIKACAVMSVCHEPGCHTIFQEASPTFKKRFMYMSGITDEDEFDAFRQKITWQGHAEKIRVPYLCVAGEAEELSPLEHSRALVAALGGPKRMVVYQDSRHSVGNVPAANLGPFPPVLVADWLAERLAGKPFASEYWYVAASGAIDKTAY